MDTQFRYKRDQRTVTVTTSGVQIAGSNPRRKKLILSAPAYDVASGLNQGAVGSGLNGAATGVRLSYTVPASVQATGLSATLANITGGAPTVSLQIVRGATTYFLGSFTTQQQLNLPVPLQAGDVIQWNVTTAVGGSTFDATLGVQLDPHSLRITVSALAIPTLDSGLNIYPGLTPQYLDADIMGSALTEQLFGISAFGSPQISVIDIFT
jgi:hypothetical protein